MLRVDYPDGGKAAMIQISSDGHEARFDPGSGFIDFPGGAKKFTIRYDAKSRRYWSLTNYVPPEHRGPNAAALATRSRSRVRPTCAPGRCGRSCSHHPDREKHGFQYVDWLFEGNDIIAVCRTAWDDESGGAHNFHDANFMTFHRIRNFRKLKGPAVPTWKE